MKKHMINEVFTPNTPAKLTFVEREKINNRIVRALNIPGNQIVIYGHSGCGKTTLIENKLCQTYERHVKTNCMKGMTYEEIILDAFDQISPYYTLGIENNSSTQINGSISADYLFVKSQISTGATDSNKISKSRLLPPQLTGQNLARFMGNSNSCWVLEDFHKLEVPVKEKLTQLMKVFMDKSNEYPNLKIIYIGAVNSAREVVQLDREMRRRVSEIHVPLMTNEEILEIMNKGFRLLNIGLHDQGIALDVCNQCSGLPAICHKLCLLICEDMGINETVLPRQSVDPNDYDELEDDAVNVIEKSAIIQDSLREKEKEDPYAFPIETESEIHDEKNTVTKKIIRKNLQFFDNKNIINATYKFEAIEATSGLTVDYDNLKYALSEYLADESDTIKCAFERAFKEKYAEDTLEALSECDRVGVTLDELHTNLRYINSACCINELEILLIKMTQNEFGSVIRFLKDSEVY